jgi:hypothetical protein
MLADQLRVLSMDEIEIVSGGTDKLPHPMITRVSNGVTAVISYDYAPEQTMAAGAIAGALGGAGGKVARSLCS